MIPMTNDDQAFKPYKPEKTVEAVITTREASLLDKLRKHAYGKFLVHKVNGLVIRVEINEAQLIQESDEVNLE